MLDEILYTMPQILPHIKKQSANTDGHDQDTSMNSNVCTILEYLLAEQGFSVNCTNTDGSTPLHVATGVGNIKTIQCLIKHGANVKARAWDLWNVTPLHTAVTQGSKEVVQYLIDHGAEVMARDTNNETPLHALTETGKEVVQCLIEHGADVMARDVVDRTPLHHTVVHGSTEVVQCMIKYGADVMARDGFGVTPLHNAVKHGNKEVVQCLIKLGADVMARDMEGTYPWTIACECEKQYCEIMAEVLDGIDLKQKLHNGMSLLHLSCLSGSICSANYLLKNGVDVNCTDVNNSTPLFFLCMKQHVFSSVDFGLAQEGQEALHNHQVEQMVNQMSRNWQIRKLLVESGADVNHRDKNGHTLLMERWIYKQKEIREFLIEHGADLNAVGRDGLTVLWTAIEYDCEAEFYLIDDLLARNIDIGLNWYRYNGMTPLQLACSKGNYELCDILLDAGCSFQNMLEFMDANINLESDENMQRVRSRIVELSAQPYSLQELSRQAVLREMGSGNLVEKVYCMKEEAKLPVNLLNFLIRNLGFKLEVELLPLDEQDCQAVP